MINLKNNFNVCLLILSASINLGLGTMLIKTRHRSQSAIRMGTIMPPLHVLDQSNRSVTIDYGEVPVPTVVYVLSPSCTFCRQNMKNMTTIGRVTAGRFRIIGLSIVAKGLEEFSKEANMGFPVYSNLDSSASRAFRLGGTPQTFVIGHDGRLQAMWTGAYFGSTQKKVEAFFRIHLGEGRS